MADYLLTINAVRAKSTPIFELAFTDSLTNFDSQFDNKDGQLDSCIDFIVRLIKRDFGTDYKLIPPHGRWQHLEAGKDKPRVKQLISQWQKEESENVDQLEITRRLIDLFVVSVFLDAGAGNVWKYKEPNTENDYYNRSEGLAVASYYIFANGEFAIDDETNKHQVNAAKLDSVTEVKFKQWLQVDDKSNPLAGFDGRLELLKNLGTALSSNNEIFGGAEYYKDPQIFTQSNKNRPGNIVDYLMNLPNTKNNGKEYEINLTDLWDGLMKGFNSIWKSRIELEGKSLGDAWYSKSAEKIALKTKDVTELTEADKIVPFHKLTQWLTYSLLVPLKQHGNFVIADENLMTGLPEYRNGGLLLDFGLLTIKPEAKARGIELAKKLNPSIAEVDIIPTYVPDDDLIVEWRSCTVGFLDYLLPLVNEKLNIAGTESALKLPQLIEAGSWKAGREIAKAKRPQTSGPSINLHSDGTVF